MDEQSVIIKSKDELRELFGQLDTKIKLISQSLSVTISTRNSNHLTISGKKNNVNKAAKVIEDLLVIIRGGYPVNLSEIRYQIDMIKENDTFHLNELYKEAIQVFKKDKIIRPKTFGQKQILEKINNNDILFVIGPAGSGKTYLAVALAISALRKKEVDRIILIRPAVKQEKVSVFYPVT